MMCIRLPSALFFVHRRRRPITYAQTAVDPYQVGGSYETGCWRGEAGAKSIIEEVLEIQIAKTAE